MKSDFLVRITVHLFVYHLARQASSAGCIMPQATVSFVLIWIYHIDGHDLQILP
jgi:hypothetical protein